MTKESDIIIRIRDRPKQGAKSYLYAVTMPHIYDRVMGIRGLLNIS